MFSRLKRGAGRLLFTRPLVRLALIFLFILLLLKAAGHPLRKIWPAEALLTEEESAFGVLSGRLKSLRLSSSGDYLLILEKSQFIPENQSDRKAFPAGAVLVFFPEADSLKIGSLLTVKGSLSLFPRADNPGEFDAREYYHSQGMALRMEAEALSITEERASFPGEALRRVREGWIRRLGRLYNAEEAGLLGAMLLGERGGVDDESERLYEQAGITHLLSVSGLHVGFWALFLSKAAGFLILLPFRRGGGGRLARRGFLIWRAAAAGLAILFYLGLCGARLPVQRAGLMALCAQLAQALGASFDLPSAVAAAALAALLPSPLALFQASFQLSFGCVLLLGCLFPYLGRRLFLKTPAARAMLAPALLQAGMLPLQLWHYFAWHPYALFVNLLVCPLGGVILLSGFLSIWLLPYWEGAAAFCSRLTHLILSGISLLCRGVSALPAHSVYLGRPYPWQMAVYLLLLAGGTLTAVRNHRRKMLSLAQDLLPEKEKSVLRLALREGRRTAGLLIILAALAASVFTVRDTRLLRIESLYVGQGDCHVIRLPRGGVWVVDCGSAYGKNAGERLLNYLHFHGIRRLEGVMISHPDADHINGLPGLLGDGSIRTEALYLPRFFEGSAALGDILAAAEKAGTEVIHLSAGDVMTGGGAVFDILHPPREGITADENENSLVLSLSYGDFSALFTGDLGEEGERALLASGIGKKGAYDYLKLGHHGSRFSSTQGFLNHILPRAALISCGRGNRYGHPSEETLARLALTNAHILRTDKMGAAGVETDGKGLLRGVTYHLEEEDMKSNEHKEKITRGTWIFSGLLLALGLAAVCLSMFLPGKNGTESETPQTGAAAQASSQAGGGETAVSYPPETAYSFPPPYSEEESWPEPEMKPRESAADTARAETLAPIEAWRNAGRGGPAEDLLAEGFQLDRLKTDELYLLLAGELSNRTEPEDAFRSLPAELKKEIDALAESFSAGEINAEEAAFRLKERSFSWPDEGAGFRHPLGAFSFRIYQYPAADMELIRERILLGNHQGRHYLFVRVYYHPGEDALRIYMVNGMAY